MPITYEEYLEMQAEACAAIREADQTQDDENHDALMVRYEEASRIAAEYDATTGEPTYN